MSMNSQTLVDQINALLGTEVRSLARHLDEATPYLSPRTYRAWSAVKHMSQTSRDHAGRLTALLEGMDQAPRPGAFESTVANYHYVTLDSLLPLLIEEKQRQLAVYQAAVDESKGNRHVTEELQVLMVENQTMLSQLQALMEPYKH